ncbi:MAG: heavy-metal-associated domain-containing protein [Chloroflexi bacterium]|nr:heavy-metal-associated domain-containing protein [Chloroflexota bacterium]
MITLHMSFPIVGMKAARCADAIQTSLGRVDGVISARVNYATERARILFVPTRNLATALLNAVRADGCDIPLVITHVALRDLMRTSVRLDAVVSVWFDWRHARVTIESLSYGDSGTPAPASLRTAINLLARLVWRSEEPALPSVGRPAPTGATSTE